jgi:phage baseplate assembly protein gpV
MYDYRFTELEILAKVGTVSAVDSDKRMARVSYPDTEVVSDWLFVIWHPIDGYPCDVCQCDGCTRQGRQRQWMPTVGKRVLTLYLPVPGGDGFILGELQ